jgi:hypothetical protein
MPNFPDVGRNIGFPLMRAAFPEAFRQKNHPEPKNMTRYFNANGQPQPEPSEEEMREDLDNLHPDWREDLEDYDGDIAALHAEVMKRQGRTPAERDDGWFDPLPGEEPERSEDDWPRWFEDDD